ncbi:MAG: ferredoxin--nitrite reductase [Roseofilum sp. SBFL]|uniref:ferredoxin--nitrite reductase n=1 Tax=unclassified Roseofilum TaxID=2620099 RepID=UPI001B0E46E9|nr:MULTISPECIES: ferredoxin--nitrite reductase [unclassified Roseofilum]MBP0013220.1 ferredoxin--nitrite reductase [Roseofilum sp. SID3]MBP0025984.1 ferredoxin--nitrite reductase [Roseofilum sp. SID2]MBP0037853.1 ferredoxin--nitrite reductase [Roseofilum sp. SID1]MBP0041913.1 ferredoxin--nitrite reductase [Roseofilum sp. SBFL]
MTTVPSTETLNKFERFKAEKDGLAVKEQLKQFAQMGWESIDETDRDQRLKWLGIFFRPVTPGKFMLRMRMPNGILTSKQMRVLAETTENYGEDGNADITTRQNLQLRGIRLEDIPQIFDRFQEVGLTSMQSGMDNVRNITGSPVAGIDSAELIDTRPLVQATQDMITNSGQGNPEFTNLPRKFNIAIAGSRDNSVHAEINDIAYVPAYRNGILGFNILVGGFFSGKRCEAAIPLDVWIEPSECVALSRAILLVYRDHGLRANRQKSRLMWLIDEWGLERFRATVEQQLGKRLPEAAPKDEFDWDKRDHIGIHKQKQPGFNYAGLHIPVGRLYPPDLFELARLGEVYGDGEIRLTIEQNAIIANIPDSRLEAFLAEPLLQKFSINPDSLSRALVSCTGAQFCKFALIETKNRASTMMAELSQELTLEKPVRIHWTGCPNSCGQPQVADIGLMGTKTRKNGKTVEAVDIFMGGKVGKEAQLGQKVIKAIPCEDLKSVLRNLLIEQFGAQPKAGYVAPTPDMNGNGAKLPVIEPLATPVGTVQLAKTGKTFLCYKGESILEAAEREGLDLESSCRSGTCGTCQQQLVSGEVRYLQDPQALGEQQGAILTCIAHPVGEIVLDA